jgi:hypothetical protein
MAVVAMLMPQGAWSSAVMLINVITAALLAASFWEPLAQWMDDQVRRATYLVDFVAIWLLFVVILLILRTLTGFASRYNVRFPKVVEIPAAFFFAGWTAWVMVCFTLMTLHMAPLARNFMGGGFQPESRLMFGVAAPDRQWLGFVQKMSLGAFSRGDPQENNEAHVFDPRGEYLPKYASRREQYENIEGIFLPGQ